MNNLYYYASKAVRWRE